MRKREKVQEALKKAVCREARRCFFAQSPDLWCVISSAQFFCYVVVAAGECFFLPPVRERRSMA